MSPERRTSIAAAGRNQDNKWHVEVFEKLPGTNWLASKLLELVERHQPTLVVCDGLGPGKSLVQPLEALDVKVETYDSGQHAEACGRFVDAVNEDSLRHLGSNDLINAVRGAKARTLGDRWAWSRKNSSVDISPLVAVTLALYAATSSDDDGEDPVIW